MATVTERIETPGGDEDGREPWLPTRVVYTGGPPESDQAAESGEEAPAEIDGGLTARAAAP